MDLRLGNHVDLRTNCSTSAPEFVEALQRPPSAKPGHEEGIPPRAFVAARPRDEVRRLRFRPEARARETARSRASPGFRAAWLPRRRGRPCGTLRPTARPASGPAVPGD